MRSVRAALGLLVAAVLVPLAVAGAVFLWTQWEREREQALSRLQGQAQALQLAVDRELALDLAVLQTLAASPDIDRGDWAGFHAAAQRAAAVRPGSLVTVFAPDGRNLVNTSVAFGTPLPNVRQRPPEREVTWQGRALPLPTLDLFMEPFETARPKFSGLVWGRFSRRPVVATHLPVLRDGRAVHVIGLAYGVETYGRLLAATDEPAGFVKALVDGRGLVVARAPGHETLVGRRAPHRFAQGGHDLPPKGTGRGTSIEDVPVYYAHSRSTVNDWTVVVAMPEHQVLAPAWRSLWASLAILLGAAALGSHLAIRLSRRLAVPLNALAAQARALGTPAPAIPPSRIEEVDTLAAALREAAANQQLRQQVEREREQAREQLRLANERLTEADRHKDAFLGMLSHELRNPLAPIRNSLYILERADPAGPIAQRAKQTIERQVQHMTELVDDLLDVTRVARGKVELRLDELELTALVRRVEQDYRDVFESRQIRLTTRLPGEAVRVHGDPTRIAQVVGNLLHNAAKFTPAGGGVTLCVDVQGGEAVLEVADTGAGIEPGMRDAIFQPFVQGGRDSGRNEGGLGLGLALVKGLVELHGGRVEVSSDGAGRGSRFTVRLPLARDAVRAERPVERRGAPRPEGCRHQVLVVDDNRDSAHSLADMIRLLGHEVDVAHDGAGAIRRYRERRPDTVLCDIGLPGMNGYELAASLRGENGAGARLIALSGYARPEDVRRAAEAGFAAHIAKPADPKRILALLGQVPPTAAKCGDPARS